MIVLNKQNNYFFFGNDIIDLMWLGQPWTIANWYNCQLQRKTVLLRVSQTCLWSRRHQHKSCQRTRWFCSDDIILHFPPASPCMFVHEDISVELFSIALLFSFDIHDNFTKMQEWGDCGGYSARLASQGCVLPNFMQYTAIDLS